MGPKGFVFVTLSSGFCVTSSFRGLVLSSGLTTCRHMEHIAAFLINLFVLAPSSLFSFLQQWWIWWWWWQSTRPWWCCACQSCCRCSPLLSLRSDSKNSARKIHRGKNAATRLPKNATVFYCGGGLLIGPGLWLTIFMTRFFPGHEH